MVAFSHSPWVASWHTYAYVSGISLTHPDRLIANHPSLVKPPPLDINHNLYSNILRAMILE